MKLRSPHSQTAIRAQIRALRTRIEFLEQALKPRKLRNSQKNELNESRERAEERARNNALLQFYHQRKIEFYLRNPDWLAKDLAREKEIADFLTERGITPEPSSIPEQFRRGLKKYLPQRKD